MELAGNLPVQPQTSGLAFLTSRTTHSALQSAVGGESAFSPMLLYPFFHVAEGVSLQQGAAPS